MANKRLSEDLRRQIADALVKKAVGPRVTDLRVEAVAVLKECYSTVYGRDRTRMRRLPDGWLPSDRTFVVTYEDGRDGHLDMSTCGRRTLSEFSVAVSVGSAKGNHLSRYVTLANYDPSFDGPVNWRVDGDYWRHLDRFGRQLDVRSKNPGPAREFSKKAVALCDEIRHLHSRTLQALRQFNTERQLREGWPEVAEACADLLEPPPSALPAVPLDDLTAALGVGSRAPA